MTSEELSKMFAHYAEDAQFKDWSQAETPGMRFVYACEYGTIWKFTLKAWWQFVTQVVRNNGCHDLFLSKALRSRPKYIVKGEDNKFYSSDRYILCMNPLDWTLLDWNNELLPGRRKHRALEHNASLKRPDAIREFGFVG